MGFFDKLKHFAGGHGVKVTNIQIERQEPPAVSMPIGDTVVKGKFVVTADKPSEVLSMQAEFCMELKHADGRVETVVLGKDFFPDPNCSRQDDMVKYPYTLQPGDSVQDFYIIHMNEDIQTALAKRNASFGAAKFFVRTMVDVKGSPFDPEAKDTVQITN